MGRERRTPPAPPKIFFFFEASFSPGPRGRSACFARASTRLVNAP